MADPFNLTIDESVFDDTNNELPSPIDESLSLEDNINEVCQLLTDLDGRDVNIQQLENRLQKILFKGEQDFPDITGVTKLLTLVSKKIHHFSAETGRITIDLSKQLFSKVSLLNNPSELKSYIENISSCLNHVSSKGSCTESLVSSLQIVEKAYSICLEQKNGADMLYQPASELSLAVVKILDQHAAFDQNSLVSLSQSLMNIGRHSFKSVNTMAAIWKQVVKLLKQNPDVCPQLGLGASIQCLVREILNLLEHFKNGKNLMKLAKATGFLLKVVTTFLDLQTNLLDEEKETESVLNLVLELHRFSPDILKYEQQIPDDLIRLIESQIAVTVHPLLNHLIMTKRLWPCLQKISTQCPASARLHLCRVIGLMLTPYYQSTLGHSIELNQLLELFLSNVDQAHADLSGSVALSGVINTQQSAQPVPAYELLVVQASSGIAVAQPAVIPQCVVVLLGSVVRQGLWAFLMASDILCFMARYGTSQFCQDLVLCTFRLAQPDSRLMSLLNRLLPLLSPAGRAALIKSYPVERYPDVWAALSWASFSSDQQAAFVRYFFPSTAPNVNKAATIVRLHSLCSSNGSSLASKSDYTTSLMKVVTTLGAAGSRPSAKGYKKHLQHLIACIVRILFHIVQPGQKEDQQHLVQLLKLAFEYREIPIVQLDAANYLRSIAPVPVAGSQHQQSILRGISTLFSDLVSSCFFVVQLSALRSFEVFAKTTPHSDVVASCVKSEDQPMVANFVKRNASRKPMADLVSFFQSQSSVLSTRGVNISNILSKLVVEPIEIFGNGQMPAKRPRLDKEGDEQLLYLMKNLDKAITEIGLNGPLPSWAREEIREKIQRLNSLLC